MLRVRFLRANVHSLAHLYSAPNDDERYELFGLLGAYDTNCVGKVGVSKCECMCLR